MAEIRTIVELSKKEMDDALITLARSQLDKCIGGAEICYDVTVDGATEPVVEGVHVTFTGKIKT